MLAGAPWPLRVLLALFEPRFRQRRQRLFRTAGLSRGDRARVELMRRVATDGDDLLVAASQGDVDREPQWWLNLLADPHAEVTLRGRRFAVTAERVGAAERPQPPARVVALYPGFDRYQAQVRREIAIIRLRPNSGRTASEI